MGIREDKGGCWRQRGLSSVTLSLIIMRQIQSTRTLKVQDRIRLSIIHTERSRLGIKEREGVGECGDNQKDS